MKRKEKWNQENIWTFSQLSDNEPIICGLSTYKYTTTPSYDMHYGIEMGIVRSGKMRRYYEDSFDDLSTGDVWFCGMWEPHGYEIIEAPCQVIVMIILPQILADLYFTEAPKINWLTPFIIPAVNRPKLGKRTQQNILMIANRIEKVIHENDHQKKLWLRLFLLEALLEVQKVFPFYTSLESLENNDYNCINYAITNLIKSHRNVTTIEISNDCGISRNRFNSIFKKMMGISFAKFSLRYRISSAATELIISTDPLKIIADKWGFTDASHFIHSFVKHFNCTPTQYRKNNTR